MDATMSQLPFGFDVDGYDDIVRHYLKTTMKSQLPFGFDVG